MRRLKRVLYPFLSLLARPFRERIVALAYARADSARGAERSLWTERATALRQKLYGRSPVIRLARRDGLRLWVNIAEWEGGNVYFGRPYEPLETEVAHRLIVAGGTVIDVGANVGLYTLLASRAVGTSGRVFAFEPAFASFALLQRNVGLAGATNVVLEQAAVSDVAGTATLLLNRESGLASLGPTGRGERTGSETVRCVTLDEYADTRGIGPVCLLKIDVEGFEGHVLRGGRSMLEREQGIAVLAELAEANFKPLGLRVDDVIALMRSLGFAAWQVRRGSLVPLSHGERDADDFFFARPGTPAADRLAALSAPAGGGS